MTTTALAVGDPSEAGKIATWAGSRFAAPGPGAREEDGKWYLRGRVVWTSRTDSDSLKIRWDNKRTTIERRTNLKV